MPRPPRSMPKPPPQATIWTWLQLGLGALLLALLLPFVISPMVIPFLGTDYGVTYTSLFVIILLGAPTSFVAIVTAIVLWKQWRLRSESHDFFLAREASGDQGTC